MYKLLSLATILFSLLQTTVFSINVLPTERIELLVYPYVQDGNYSIEIINSTAPAINITNSNNTSNYTADGEPIVYALNTSFINSTAYFTVPVLLSGNYSLQVINATYSLDVLPTIVNNYIWQYNFGPYNYSNNITSVQTNTTLHYFFNNQSSTLYNISSGSQLPSNYVTSQRTFTLKSLLNKLQKH